MKRDDLTNLNDNEFLFEITSRLGMCFCGYGAAPKFALMRQMFSLLTPRLSFSEGSLESFVKLVGGNETVAFFLIDWLEKADLVEHGGSQLGAWPTKDGERFHACLQKYSDEDMERLSEMVPARDKEDA